MSTSRVFIIAEAGVNHNGSLEQAKQLVEVAAAAGADAVKFQTFRASKLVSRSAPKAEYQIRTTGGTESQFDMIRKLELSEDAHDELISYSQEKGIEFLSTPFDCESVTLLMERFSLSRIKVSSGDITNAPLLLKIAQTGKPVLLSTGMATLGEIEDALGVLAFGYLGEEGPSAMGFRSAYSSAAGQQALRDRVTLLHCTTEYPAPFDEVNLKSMEVLSRAFRLPVGYSDHTKGISVPIAAAALGAVVIEKHFTIDATLPGPDHKASLEPRELQEMVRGIRVVEKALGTGGKYPTHSECKNMTIARKSLVASQAIAAGEIFSEKNLTIKRPGDGLSPMRFWEFLGKRAPKAFSADEVIES